MRYVATRRKILEEYFGPSVALPIFAGCDQGPVLTAA